MDPIQLKVFAVDPGTQDLGYSVYVDGKIDDFGKISARDSNPYKRCEAILKELFLEICQAKPDLVVCEKPLKRGPGGRSGYIFVLHHFCGMLHGVLTEHNIPFKYVEVMEWKGSLPKNIHHPRIKRNILAEYKIDIEKESEDTIDAIGLGHWFIKNGKVNE
jgi:hypothetical protein